jgi:O-antigen ligase
LPTLLIPHPARRDRTIPLDTGAMRDLAPRWTRLAARLRIGWASAVAAWRLVLEVALAMLAIAFVLGRLPLPAELDLGYRSCARIVALLFLAGVLCRAPGITLSRSPIGKALLGLTLVATLSVWVASGRTAAVSALWTALGVFHATRVVASDERGRRHLLHGLGLLCVAILARELWSEPALLWLREQHRHTLVTEHPNTLGLALALLMPVLLAATAQRRLRASACLYASAAALVLLATFSRAAWLALGGTIVALAIATRSDASPTAASAVRARRSSRARIELAVVAAIVLAVAVAIVSRDRTGGDTQRIRILETSWSLFVEHWPLGIGFGSGNLEPLFPVRYLERNGESLFLFHSHDLYVDLLTGCGVAGALAALLLFAAVGRVAWRGIRAARHPATRAEAAGYATSFGVFLALGVVDTPLYHGRSLLLSVILWAMLDGAASCAVGSHEPKKAAARAIAKSEKPRNAARRERHWDC